MNPLPTVTGNHKLTNLIAARQIELGKSDAELAAAMGFERSNIVSLIKSGAIKLPLNKIPELATALDLDPSELMITAMQESDPELLAALQRIWEPIDLTDEEKRLIQACRKLSAGRRAAPVVFGDSVIALVTV